ncbi:MULTISPECIES: DUF881 domain-containing protein [unclassified Nocardioides]|uniref:DUF881 domain-containing protein n=1 Tax=unclassified Nocardioides TaxID=2615069 RepID=UPI0006FD3DA6|nr:MULTISPECIES: DUF881 domain-containing protein [unclassified Nocardioides]KQY64284.1 hypothetical protein ASD30_04890 [Nocardioides sp. Root140]KQZ70203.1 hypothetical protein ASD66_11165 [Nocardioides sp. Root151]KRF16300.1 hypothetical protein ASH02_06915 [Nocardioides sp. Soil796]
MAERRPATAPEPGKTLPEHVTLPLLSLITRQSMDGDYQHVAERRKADGEERAGRRITRNTALVVALFGLMIVIAAVQTSRDAAATEEGRQELIRQISLERSDLGDAQDTISDLRATNGDLSERADDLERLEGSVTRRLLQARGASGFAPVRGPGVRITVDNSPDGTDDGRVRDEDLAMLIDGLWVAGAEAISINGQRLTSISSIRSVGDAIHVRTQPLKPPYEILAVGDPNTLQALFAESRPGLQWISLRNTFGFEFEIENSTSDLSLPASRRALLRSARVAEPEPLNKKEAIP